MEKELNIAAILKDKPNAKVWSDTFGELIFKEVREDEEYPILLLGGGHYDIDLTNEGYYFHDIKGVAPCVVPSKEMQDWEKFAWEEGEVLHSDKGVKVCLFNGWKNDTYTEFFGKYHYSPSERDEEDVWQYRMVCKTSDYHKSNDPDSFIELLEKHEGGKLNLETLDIEEFKDGDIVHCTAGDITDEAIFIAKMEAKGVLHSYVYMSKDNMKPYTNSLFSVSGCLDNLRLATDSEKKQLFDALAKENKRWNPDTLQVEDLPKKCELKPFDKVLIKDHDNDRWEIDFFAYYDEVNQNYATTSGNRWNFCIPYNDSTKHLLGTTDEWEGGGK